MVYGRLACTIYLVFGKARGGHRQGWGLMLSMALVQLKSLVDGLRMEGVVTATIIEIKNSNSLLSKGIIAWSICAFSRS